MSSRVAGFIAALAAAGCATTQSARPAPGSLAAHADAGMWAGTHAVGTMVSADMGFEKSSCCGAALYIGMAHEVPNADYDLDDLKTVEGPVLEGGLEAGVALFQEQRLRVRARLGKAGTTPKSPLAGRAGIAASAAVLYRVVDGGAPAVNGASPALDLFVGAASWNLGRQSSPAGALDGDDDLAHPALILGIRLGADYGVDFE